MAEEPHAASQRAAERLTLLAALFALEGPWNRQFDNPRTEARRLFSELFGTFLLVTVAAMETLITVGLVSTILGTASRAQNVGALSAVAVGGYVALAGLWASPVSGASMNPARSFGPDLIRMDFSHFLVYAAGPLLGAIVAVAIAYVLRGPGGDPGGVRAAQGRLDAVADRAA